MATGTKRRSRKSWAEAAEARAATAKALRDRLGEWQEEADEALVAMALATHDGYSDRNAMLIAMQDPEATMVRGYVTWQTLGRQVGRLPEDAPEIVILSYRGEFKAAEAEAAPAEPIRVDSQAGDGEGGGGEEKLSKHFAPTGVYDIRWTVPAVCEECGEPIHRTGMETKEQMEARGGRKRAALWTHTAARPADGHKARKGYDPDQAPMTPQKPEAATVEQIKAAERAAAELAEQAAEAAGLDEIEV